MTNPRAIECEYDQTKKKKKKFSIITPMKLLNKKDD